MGAPLNTYPHQWKDPATILYVVCAPHPRLFALRLLSLRVLNTPSPRLPLFQGHKYSYFEGGIRATTFVHSPLLPSKMVGRSIDTLCHISDWWVTFTTLAGLKPDDGYAEAPPDGVDLWPVLTGQVTVCCASTLCAFPLPLFPRL